MLGEILIFIVTTIFLYIMYTYKKMHWTWWNRDVKFLEGVPFFGNTYKSAFSVRHSWEDIDEVYRAFPEERYVGYADGLTPAVIIRDPELIKMITVKDFDHFMDHRTFFSDPLFNESLLMMQGEKWRDMRTTLSPAFTGAKMRHMVSFMIETSYNILEHLKETEGENVHIDDLIRRYTNDVIASTAFGLQINSLKDKKNDFYVAGQTLVNFSLMQKLKIFTIVLFPFLSKALPIFPKHVTDFFLDIVRTTMEHREKNKIERPDMIQLLMEATKGTIKTTYENEKEDVGFAAVHEINTKVEKKKYQWTQEQITAQAFIFFFAGFESSASVLVLAIHEIALNNKIQEKLYEEISNNFRIKPTLEYDDMPKLKYLDCVINEALRKWAPALIMDRICNKSYTLPPSREGGKAYRIQPGELIYCMINSIHWDEKHFKEPNKFDPERFSEENRHTIKPFTFMPFGSGPRNCIASRFALLEAKILLYHIILNFEILKCDKTSDNIPIDPNGFAMQAAGGTWVKFQERN